MFGEGKMGGALRKSRVGGGNNPECMERIPGFNNGVHTCISNSYRVFLWTPFKIIVNRKKILNL